MPLRGKKVRVTVGGKRAEVVYAGAAPHFVAGLLAVNFRIPMDAPGMMSAIFGQ
jgi:uncharacterized protein (TIGR03437 family)